MGWRCALGGTRAACNNHGQGRSKPPKEGCWRNSTRLSLCCNEVGRPGGNPAFTMHSHCTCAAVRLVLVASGRAAAPGPTLTAGPRRGGAAARSDGRAALRVTLQDCILGQQACIVGPRAAGYEVRGIRYRSEERSRPLSDGLSGGFRGE